LHNLIDVLIRGVATRRAEDGAAALVDQGDVCAVQLLPRYAAAFKKKGKKEQTIVD